MKHKLAIVDTSWLCVYLSVPGKDECTGNISLSTDEARQIWKEEDEAGVRFVLPLTTVIETGNHIAQAPRDRREVATTFVKDMILEASEANAPWIVFSQQLDSWQPDQMGWLKDWPDYAEAKLSIGDMAIKQVADFYSRLGYEVEIFTCDEGLKAHQPASPTRQPRRRKS